jgi:uroporphyrinogen decarboxylase
MRRPEPDFAGFVSTVLRRGEPDKVRFAELFHDWEIMVAIQGPPTGPQEDADAHAAWRVRFWRDLGYDYVSQGVNVGFPGSGLMAEDTAILSRGQREWAGETKGPISSWEEFEACPWPRVTPAAFQDLESLGRQLPDGMKAVAMLPGGPFENLMFLMGFEQLSYALVEQPDLVEAIAERVGETLCALVENTTSMEWVGAQWLNDDMGFKTATLVSPEVFRRYVFPTQRRICEIAHAHGKPVFLHSCGKLDEIMDELIDDIGIDAKHSFEDVIMPVWEAKRKWGSRVGLLGGVDMNVLAGATEDEVRAYTRRCLEECLPGGGWALGSGNTVANYVPVGNFLAMLDEGRRWRR